MPKRHSQLKEYSIGGDHRIRSIKHGKGCNDHSNEKKTHQNPITARSAEIRRSAIGTSGFARRLEPPPPPMDSLMHYDCGWRTELFQTRQRSDAWENALSTCYRDWQLSGALTDAFSARLRRRRIGDMTLVECSCGPCSGRRENSVIRHDDDPYLGLQVVLDGTERFHTQEGNTALAAGDCIIWSTTEPLEFGIPDHLRKSTLLIPHSLVRERLTPRYRIKSFKLHSRQAIGPTLRPQLLAPTNHFDCLELVDQDAVKWSTVELLTAAIVDRCGVDRRWDPFRGRLLDRTMKSILDTLEDSEPYRA